MEYFSYDTLTLYDGNSAASVKVGEFCDSMPSSFITTSNEAFIHFETNHVYTDTGFKLEYEPESKLNKISHLDLVASHIGPFSSKFSLKV